MNLPQDAQLQELHAELSHARNALREMARRVAGKEAGQGSGACPGMQDRHTAEERLQDMLAESKIEVERTKSELATVTARLAEAQSHVSRAILAKQDSQKWLRESLDRAEQQVQDERAQRDKLESECTQLEAQSAAFRVEIDNLRKELESSIGLVAGSPADEQISQAMEECATAMKEVAQLQANNVNMQERIVQLETELSQQRTANNVLKKEVAANKVDLQDKQAAIVSLQGSTKNCLELQAENEKLAGELKEEKDQHFAKLQQLESTQSAMAFSGKQMKQAKEQLEGSLRQLAAGNEDLSARLADCQRKLDAALTAKGQAEQELNNTSAQLSMNQRKSFEMMEVLERTREELANAKSRAQEQENHAHKMASRLAESKSATGNLETELQTCLDRLSMYKQDFDDLKQHSVPLNKHMQCVDELAKLKTAFEALELENTKETGALKTEKEARAQELQQLSSSLEVARREVQELQNQLESSQVQHAVELKVAKKMAVLDEDSLRQDLEHMQTMAEESKSRLKSLEDEVLTFKARDAERELELQETKKKLQYEQRRGKRLEQQASAHEMLRSELESYRRIIATMRLPNGVNGSDMLEQIESSTSSCKGEHAGCSAGNEEALCVMQKEVRKSVRSAPPPPPSDTKAEIGPSLESEFAACDDGMDAQPQATKEPCSAGEEEELCVMQKEVRKSVRSAPPPPPSAAAAEIGPRFVPESESAACDGGMDITKEFRKGLRSSLTPPVSSETKGEAKLNLQAALDVLQKFSARPGPGAESVPNEVGRESLPNDTASVSAPGSRSTTPINLSSSISKPKRECISMQEAVRRGVQLENIVKAPDPPPPSLGKSFDSSSTTTVTPVNALAASILRDTDAFSSKLSPGLSSLYTRPKMRGQNLGLSPADKKMMSRILAC